jgi:ATP-dependent Clp protease ATP-binding subunit ClpA
MWEKFAPRLRKNIFAALEEACADGAPEATPGHLLGAIARDHASAAAFILDQAGVDRAKLLSNRVNNARVERLSDSMLALLRESASVAESVGDSHVGTEHVIGALAQSHLDALASQGFTYGHFLAGRQTWIDHGMPR